MAEAVTLSESETGEIRKISWAWTSATTETVGAATEATTTKRYSGLAMRFVTIPAAGGDAPTASYDVTITDDDGYDVLNGQGADRSATATETKTNVDGLTVMKSSKLKLNVAAAGETKKGTVVLYVLKFD